MRSFKITSLLVFAIALLSCNSGNSVGDESGESITEDATLLRIYKDSLYTQVDVLNHADTSRKLASYILVPKGAPIPNNLPEGTVIRTPVSKALVYSSVFAGPLKELDAIGAVRGVADASYFKIPEIREGLKSGAIIDVGAPASPSKEKIIELQPDAILLSIYEGMDAADVADLGFPIVKMCDNLEPTPLSRAEWIRFIGLLTGREARADSIFNSVKAQYNELRTKAKSVKSKPKILTDNLYQGVWYVPGGNSYQARLISDAGGNYFKSGDESIGSLSLSFEQVLDEAADADIWLLKLYGTGDVDKNTIRNLDPRYLQFKPVQTGSVWWTDTSKSELYEEFPFHPEYLLAEYIAIFHPEKLPDHCFRYFKKMK